MTNPVGPPRRIFVEAGQRFGNGTVICEVPGSKPRTIRLRCDCGTEYTARLGNVMRGTKSCGCLKAVKGLRHHPLRGTWYGMLHRCEDPSHDAYHRYGGRGIKVCEAWHDFLTFAEDIERLIGARPEGHTLDRVNNEGNYEPGNVRWATPGMQNANRDEPGSQKLTSNDAIICTARYVNGESFSALAREFGIHNSVMNRRVHAVLRSWEHFWEQR